MVKNLFHVQEIHLKDVSTIIKERSLDLGDFITEALIHDRDGVFLSPIL